MDLPGPLKVKSNLGDKEVIVIVRDSLIVALARPNSSGRSSCSRVAQRICQVNPGDALSRLFLLPTETVVLSLSKYRLLTAGCSLTFEPQDGHRSASRQHALEPLERSLVFR